MFVSAHIAKMEFPGSPTTIEICVRCTARGVGVRPAVCWLAKANNLIGYVQRRSARPHQDNRRTDAHSPFLKLLRKTSSPALSCIQVATSVLSTKPWHSKKL